MNQQALDLNLCTRPTRKMELLELMEGVVPWREFVSQLATVAPPKAKREEVQDVDATWRTALQPGKRRALDKQSPLGATLDRIEQLKASIRAKVEHPLRVIKRQFDHTKVRYRGLKKNTAQLFSLFMLSNLWMVRKRFMQTTV